MASADIGGILFAGHSGSYDPAIVSFPGAVGTNKTVLSTVDACKGGGAPSWKTLVIAKDPLRNVSNFNPGRSEYYADHVMPRVLPWATVLVALALLLLLFFILWRVTLLSLRCCSTTAASDRYRPTASPSSVLRGRDVALLRILITFGLLATLGVCFWGFAVVGPRIVHKFWDYAEQWTAFGFGVLQLSDTVVAESAALFNASEELGTYLQSNADALRVDGLLECVDRVTDRVPEASGYLAEHLEYVAELVPEVAAAGVGAIDSLAAVRSFSLPYLQNVTGAVTSVLVLQQEVRELTRQSLESYKQLPSSSAAAFPAVDRIITSNVQLDPIGRLDLIDSASAKLLQLNSTIDARLPALQTGVADLAAFAESLEALRAATPEFSQRSRPLADLLDEASACAVDSVEFAAHVNATVAELPVNASFAISNLMTDGNTSGGSSILSDAPETERLLRALLDGVVLPDYFWELLGLLRQLEEDVRAFTPQDLDGLYAYLNGGANDEQTASEKGLRGALQAAADPLQRSTAAAVLFVKTGDDIAYTRFFTTIIDSNAALRQIAEAAEDPTGLQAAALAYTRMAAINETLSRMDAGQLQQFVNLMNYWADNELAVVGTLDSTVTAMLRTAQQLAVNGLRGGVEEAVAFIELVNITINGIHDATKEMRRGYASEAALATLDAFNNNASQFLLNVTRDAWGVRGVSIAIEDGRVAATYALFAFTCLCVVLLGIGVWLAVPFLYTSSTALLLLALVAFFALLGPLGASVTVASDGCPLLEARLLAAVEQQSDGQLSAAQVAGLRRLLNYWMFDRGASSVMGGFSQLLNSNVVLARYSLALLKTRLQERTAVVAFRPFALQRVAAVFDTALDIGSSIDAIVDELDSASVGPAFVESKALVCCTAAGMAGDQWVAMLAAGTFIFFSAICAFLFIHKMDRLPPKGGRGAMCGMYRYSASDTGAGEGSARVDVEQKTTPVSGFEQGEADPEAPKPVGGIQAYLIASSTCSNKNEGPTSHRCSDDVEMTSRHSGSKEGRVEIMDTLSMSDGGPEGGESVEGNKASSLDQSSRGDPHGAASADSVAVNIAYTTPVEGSGKSESSFASIGSARSTPTDDEEGDQAPSSPRTPSTDGDVVLKVPDMLGSPLFLREMDGGGSAGGSGVDRDSASPESAGPKSKPSAPAEKEEPKVEQPVEEPKVEERKVVDPRFAAARTVPFRPRPAAMYHADAVGSGKTEPASSGTRDASSSSASANDNNEGADVNEGDEAKAKAAPQPWIRVDGRLASRRSQPYGRVIRKAAADP